MPILAHLGRVLEPPPGCGARSGVPRRATGNRSPQGLGIPPSSRYGRSARSALKPIRTQVRCGKRSGPAQNRHGEGAERRGSNAEGSKAPPKRLACPKHAERVPRKHPYVSRRSATPKDSGVAKPKFQSPGAENAPRERRRLFENDKMQLRRGLSSSS